MNLYRKLYVVPQETSYFKGQEIIGFDLYSESKKIGFVDDILLGKDRNYHYLIVNTGAWIFPKKVLLPVGCTRIDYDDRRVYTNTLSKEQVEALPGIR